MHSIMLFSGNLFKTLLGVSCAFFIICAALSYINLRFDNCIPDTAVNLFCSFWLVFLFLSGVVFILGYFPAMLVREAIKDPFGMLVLAVSPFAIAILIPLIFGNSKK